MKLPTKIIGSKKILYKIKPFYNISNCKRLPSVEKKSTKDKKSISYNDMPRQSLINQMSACKYSDSHIMLILPITWGITWVWIQNSGTETNPSLIVCILAATSLHFKYCLTGHLRPTTSTSSSKWQLFVLIAKLCIMYVYFMLWKE